MLPQAQSKPHIKAFLSHRYKSPAVNLYFHSILSSVAEFQFDVDVGKKPTNVTRLERMIRQADAFIGVYPYPHPHAEATYEELLRESQYFRLETDLALRSRKPALIYIDNRYSRVFPPMPEITLESFDAQEIEGQGAYPSQRRFELACDHFLRQVMLSKEFEAIRGRRFEPDKVAIILSGQSIDQNRVDAIEATINRVLRRRRINRTTSIRFPNQDDQLQLAGLDSFDWAIVDVGPDLFRTGLVGYLHGRFVPMMRLLDMGHQDKSRIGEHRSLHAHIEKGYDSDLVRWSTLEELELEIEKRLEVILSGKRLIKSSTAAEAYFAEAALRREPVFLSFSGADEKIAQIISQQLKARFQDVFDYKDGESIRLGMPWQEEIDMRLQRAAVGVLILSRNYMMSEYCKQEARIMNKLRLDRKLQIFPLKVDPEALELPEWMNDTQYDHLYGNSGSVENAVERIIKLLDGQGQRAA